MKTTTFDQLKSMLKSMSLSIFPRLRNMEKNIDEIKATIPTPEKEIIFTKGEDGSYSCNITHAELWEMDADAIAKNARIINGEEEYSVRGASKKTESLYGNVIQVYADLNVGKYDLPSTYHRTLIITYCTPEILGKASAIYGENVYSLSDAMNNNATPDIPVLDGGGWMNRSIDFMEYDDLHGKYVLKTMSETTKGGAMVGKGLKMDGDALTVDEGEYELIDTVTVNEDVTILELSQESDGKQYDLTALMIRMHSAISVEDATGKFTFYSGSKGIGSAYIRSIVTKSTKQLVNVICNISHGKWFTYALGSVEDENFGRNSTIENYPVFNGYYGKEYSSVTKIRIQANGSENNIKAGTVVEIWGVRA